MHKDTLSSFICGIGETWIAMEAVFQAPAERFGADRRDDRGRFLFG